MPVTIEGLRLQIDALNQEKQKLETENSKLRNQLSKAKKSPDAEAVEELQKKLEESCRKNDGLQRETEFSKEEASKAQQLVKELEASKAQLEERWREELLLKEEQEKLTADLQLQLDEVETHRGDWEREQMKLKRDLTESKAHSDELSDMVAELKEAAARQEEEYSRERVEMCKEHELTVFRAVEEERQKWERREERIIELALMDKRNIKKHESSDVRRSPDLHPDPSSGSTAELRVSAKEFYPRATTVEHGESTREPESHLPDREEDETETVASGSEESRVTPAQLPPIPKFSGEDSHSEDTDGFTEWLEQFNMVAELCRWNDRTKLLNLIMRLKGQAYSFYRTCPPEQRSNFNKITQELRQRFTPVRIPVVESNMFHERKQGPRESVDDYAQQLKKFFYKAYPRTQQCTKEAEKMGKSVLSCQFLSGLLPDIKTKLVGVDGDFDTLLVKARFEEAKRKNLGAPLTQNPKTTPTSTGNSNSRKVNTVPKKLFTPGSKSNAECYVCGMKGHLARDCRYRGKGAPTESKDKDYNKKHRQVAHVNPGEDNVNEKQPSKVDELREKLREAELEEALANSRSTLHHVTAGEKSTGEELGPTLTATVMLEGMPVIALLDTGSPVSIVSLNKILAALASRRPQGQTPEEWERETRSRFVPSNMALRNYGGGELNVVGKITATVSCSNNTVSATLFAQPNASVDMLVGTDLLPHLGFAFLRMEGEGKGSDILAGAATYSVVEEPTPVGHTPLDIEQPTLSDDMVGNTLGSANVMEGSRDNFVKEGKVELVQVTPIVHLVTPVRIPPRHCQIVEARVQGCHNLTKSSSTIFEPSQECMQSNEVVMDTALVTTNKNENVVTVIHNASLSTMKMSPGQVLGVLKEVQSCSEDESATIHSISKEELATPNNTSLADILSSISISDEALSPEQLQQIQSLVGRYSHLFALSSSDLGHTDLIKHTIDTGEHSPIKQPAR